MSITLAGELFGALVIFSIAKLNQIPLEIKFEGVCLL